MGDTHDFFRARISENTAQEQVRRSSRRRRTQERNLRIQERLLGTEEQVEGDLDSVSEAEVPYIGRYQVNEQNVRVLDPYNEGGLGIVQGNAQKANQLLEQAQQAAREGDVEQAERLKAQADEQLFQGIRGPGVSDESLRTAYTFREDPIELARSQLDSPLARQTGELVKQGREFLDPESETSTRFKRSLTTNAQRSIAAEERDSLRRSRDIGLSRGAGRNPYNERAVDARTRERFASERAAVETEAARFFEDFSRRFSQQTVQLGQAFLQNQGGIRNEFQSSLDALSTTSSQLANAAADRFEAARARDEAREDSRTEFQRELIGTGVGVLTSAIGAAIGGSVGGVQGAQVGSSVGGGGAQGPGF